MKIQKAKDANNPTSFEEKHLPWIIIPEFIKKDKEFEVIIKVGKVNHPMTDEHYIRGVQLCIDKKCFERILLNPKNNSEAKFKISLEKDSLLTARAECNLHGVWEDKIKIVLYRGSNI